MLAPAISVRGFLIGWLTIVIMWSVLSYAIGVPHYLLAAPNDVWSLFYERYTDFAFALWVTCSEAFVGLGFAVVVGFVIGCIFHLRPKQAEFFMPLVTITQTTPVIALAPLVTFIFGYGWWSRTAAACIVAIFPVILGTAQGLNSSKKELEWPFKVIGKNEWFLLTRIRVLNAFPQLAIAVKTASIFAVIGAVVAEFMGGSEGLGFVIMAAIYGAKSANLLLAVVLSAMLGHLVLLLIEFVLTPFRHRYLQS